MRTKAIIYPSKENARAISGKYNLQWDLLKHGYIHRCLGCGYEFVSKRSDVKTCGDKCRKRLSRKKVE